MQLNRRDFLKLGIGGAVATASRPNRALAWESRAPADTDSFCCLTDISRCNRVQKMRESLQ